MRALRNKLNINPPDSDYPFGQVRNNPGDRSGTPVDENLVGDVMQFFEKLMLDSGLAMNNLPENAYSGFQLNQALNRLLKKTIVSIGIGGVDNGDGLGGGSKNIVSGHDLQLLRTQDSAPPGGFYSVSSGALNVPIAGQSGALIDVYASPNEECQIFITDTQLVYFNVKTANIWLGWIQLNGSTGWTNLTLINSWTALSTPVPQYRKSGGKIELSGQINGGLAAGFVGATPALVPASSANLFVPICNMGGGGVQILEVHTDGSLVLNAWTAVPFDLDGVNYRYL